MKFRKKPVEIEAIQNLRSNREKMSKFLKREIKTDIFLIDTLEGEMIANLEDWVIQGVKGEFYPCKPDIFELTYEAI